MKCLGIGGFSHVYLVMQQNTGKMYAMKVISKKFIEKYKKHDIVNNERTILSHLNH